MLKLNLLELLLMVLRLLFVVALSSPINRWSLVLRKAAMTYRRCTSHYMRLLWVKIHSLRAGKGCMTWCMTWCLHRHDHGHVRIRT